MPGGSITSPGIARDIWVYDMSSGLHRKITTFAGEDRNPIFTDNDKAFII